MSNQKYLKEGVNEVVTVLGAYKKENKQLYKELKNSKKEKKRIEKYLHKHAENAEEKAKENWVEIGQLKTSIVTLRQILKRASNGLNSDKLINTENLTPKQVKEILDKALEALEEEERPKAGNGCCGAIPSFIRP